MHYTLIYTRTGEEVNSYLYSDKEKAESDALAYSLAEHEKRPEDVDENGQIFMLDWLGLDKPYYGNESKFVQFITVQEIHEDDESDEE